MSFFNYPDHVLPTRNEVLVDFSEQINAAKLSSKAINNLPDSDFAYISPGGTKDSEGKTTPRSLRHLPIPDAAHVRNALARLNQQISQPQQRKRLCPKLNAKPRSSGFRSLRLTPLPTKASRKNSRKKSITKTKKRWITKPLKRG